MFFVSGSLFVSGRLFLSRISCAELFEFCFRLSLLVLFLLLIVHRCAKLSRFKREV